MRTVLSQSVAIAITGAVNSGKTWQILSLLTAKVDGEPLATPALYLMAEASAEGTAGEVLLDPSACCVWPVTDCEEANDATLACFPESGPLTLGEAKAKAYACIVKRSVAEHRVPPPPPKSSARDGETLRAIVVDTMSTLYEGSKITGSRLLKEEAANKLKPGTVIRQVAGSKGAPWNDPRNLGKYAAKHCGELIDRLNGVTQHSRGLILLVTVHTCPAVELSAGEDGEGATAMTVGQTPNLGSAKPVKAGLNIPSYSATWNALAAKMNIIWHCEEDVPNFSKVRRNDLNTAPGCIHAVITQKGIDYPNIGTVKWVKRQGGDGPLGIFNLLPAYWHPDVPCAEGIKKLSDGPSIGAALAYAVRAWKAQQSAA